MGAKAGVWVGRLFGAVGILAGLAVLVLVPAPLIAKASVLVAAILLGSVAAFRRIPAFDPAGRVRWRLRPGSAGRCAITFDDGPSAATPRVLDALAAAGAPATFFVLGCNVRRHPDAVRRAFAEGHAVAIHGMTHRKLAGADDAEVEREVAGAMAALREIGVEPSPLYRTPHGHKSAAVFRVARRFGLTPWAWSRGVWDTDRPPADVIVRRATRAAGARMVLLLHDGRGEEADPDVEPMVAALPGILAGLRARGLRPVRLDRE